MLKTTVLKLAIIGKDYTGKTSLSYACANRTFDEEYTYTVGVDYIVSHNFKNIHFCDLSGQPRFSSIILSYVKSCDIIVFCYSANNIKSLDYVLSNYSQYNKQGYLKNKHIIIIATKIDTPDIDPNYEQLGQEFAFQHNCSFVKTSSKTKEGIQEFLELCNSFANKRLFTIDLENPKPKKYRYPCIFL
jgi:small GTP-binding protein